MRITECIATFCGAGHFPQAPGTAGTVAAVPLYLLVRRLPLKGYLAVLAGVTAMGTWAAGEMEAEWGEDPGKVVIDEVAGLLVGLVSRTSSWKQIVAGVAIFRVFDILKPPPVGTLDKNVHGGVGIMADDLAAGAITAVVLRSVRRWL